MSSQSKKRVAVAMSGGVDSSVSALLLLRQGYEVVGFTAKLLGIDTSGSCCSVASAYNARRVCDKLGIPHYMVNLKEPFMEKVITRFVNEYRLGRTPNPCVDCNRFVKFKHFLSVADSLDCHYLATGHYARIKPRSSDNGTALSLLRGVDRNKDQSYFVAVITPSEMERILFPCGDYTKQEVRAIAQEARLPTAKTPDSQDVCFLAGAYDLSYWVKLVSGEEPSPGIIKDISGAKLGEHPGIEYFTRGQRKGIKIASARRRYVAEIDPRQRAIILAEPGQFLIESIELSEVNLLLPSFLENKKPVSVRTRYKQKEVLAELESLSSPCVMPKASSPKASSPALKVKFYEPQEFISPGQWCVMYDAEEVVGCGLIERLNPLATAN